MIRWLVKKVVKYVLEELKSSDYFKEIIAGLSISGTTIGTPEKVSELDKKKDIIEDDFDSMMKIADIMHKRNDEIEVSEMKGSETIIKNSNGNKKLDILREIDYDK